MRRLLAILAVVAVALTTVMGIAFAASQKAIVVGLAWNRKDQALIVAWEDYMKKYSQEYGKKIGREFKWIVNVADGDPARQDANIRDLISLKVDVIVTRPEDAAAIGAAIRAAKAAGIPIMTFDRESSTEQPDAHVGADSYTQALTTAYTFAGLLMGKGIKGKVIELMGDLRDINAVNRSKAWHQVEEELGAWETVVQVPTEWNPEKFYTGALAALKAHPDANAMFVASDFAFSAVQRALREVGRWAPQGQPGHLFIAAQDVNPQGYEAMARGYIDVATTYDAWFHAVKAVEVIARLASGEKLHGQKFLVAGRVATPQNVTKLEYMWARDYKD